MKKLVIRGGKPLTGEITINGAKNSTVALIPAAILADSEVVLEGVPDIADVYSFRLSVAGTGRRDTDKSSKGNNRNDRAESTGS